MTDAPERYGNEGWRALFEAQRLILRRLEARVHELQCDRVERIGTINKLERHIAELEFERDALEKMAWCPYLHKPGLLCMKCGWYDRNETSSK